MGPKILFLLCFTVTLRPGYCELKSSGDDESARLPEFLTELDLASLEASEEDIEAIKTVVKRLAPAKNGVMGQPGVDFPALTTIPATTFSCRGLKGGYYADLETNCQVFHICDNGRKISFLCPNGTIFQQSQLICDWWFKVDCSKSVELYEQSAEQLAEDDRKRTDARRMNSEFHRSSGENEGNNGQNYYQSQNSNYDGRQNGRTNPFGQTPGKNQIPGSSGQREQSTDFKTSTRAFDTNQIYSPNGVTPSQYNQINDLAVGKTLKTSQDVNSGQNTNSYKNRQQQPNQSSGRSTYDRGNYRATDRQQNQLVEAANEEAKRQFNYEQRGASKFPGTNQNNYNNQQNQQLGRSNQQSVDYSSTSRNVGRDNERRNFGKSSSSSSMSSGISDYEQSSNRATPSYTETTTFRTSTSSPIREYQELAESAAFATNRGNRFNEAYSSSQFNTYYNNLNSNANANNNSKTRIQQKTTEKPRQKSITPTPGSDKTGGNFLRVRVGPPGALPFPTFQPIYKPRTSNGNDNHETTTLGSTLPDTVTTTLSYTDSNTQNIQGRTSYNDYFEYATTTSYPTSQDSQVTTEIPNTEIFTDDYGRNSVTPSNEQTIVTSTDDFFENTTPTIISSGAYVNAKAYTSNKAETVTKKTFASSSGFTTSRPYSKTQEYRQNSVITARPTNESTVARSDASSSYVTTPSSYRQVTKDQTIVKSQDNRNQQLRGSVKISPKTQSSHRQSQNLISTSTEKTSRSLATLGLTQNGFTGKTLSPYDTSFTYQHGKVMSTLGPYVPFTKNYAYSSPTTSTTAKSPVYTATVPTYVPTASIYRSSSGKSLGGKFRVSSPLPSARPTGRLPSGSAAYLPEKKSDAAIYFAKKHSLNDISVNEREHAMSMLQSLRGLDGTVPSVLSASNGTRTGLNIPTSSGTSTLHSLALYFATASDDFDVTAESRTNSAAEIESTETRGTDNSTLSRESVSVELPTSILTQHTINSYAELFNLNNALEGNSSTEIVLDVDPDGSNEDTDDLDIQQSQGPIDGARKSNSTRLRELAQVFTHALSAYLQDPDTFKKILTEIRPTEPSTNPELEERFTATTLVPTTLEDYPSVTKEKDEVLDFSDDTVPLRGRRPTTIYPVTTTDLPITTDNYNRQDYYTTNSGNYYTTLSRENSNESSEENSFAFQVNHAFGKSSNGENELSSDSTGAVYYPEEASGPSELTAPDNLANNDPLNDYGDNYFPNDEGNDKIVDFRNKTKSSSTYEPYGKHVKPFDATPISDNYVSSSTPSSYQAETSKLSNERASNSRRSGLTRKSENSVNIEEKKRNHGTRNDKSLKSTSVPFRIRYYDPTTPSSPRVNNRESLVTAGSVYSKYHENSNDFTRDSGITDKSNFLTSVVTSRTIEPFTRQSYNDDDIDTVTNGEDGTTRISERYYNRQDDGKLNDHWTSSPAVTQLWESTVFVDPKRINQGLVSGIGREPSLEYSTVDYPEITENPSSDKDNNSESLVTDATSSSRNPNNLDYPSSSWKWSSNVASGSKNDNDSPTAFTLLPQTIHSTSEVNTATPSPIYTTRSSITTTITSSVTSTSSNSGVTTPRDSILPLIDKKISSRPKHEISGNDKDNEITRAQEMFGRLNTTSTNTLMRVMKQADSNATVRQLVLLLINHCNGPMNKTMEEEKEQLLDALLRMPVNEFTSEESRQLVAGINGLKLPIGKNDFKPETTSLAAVPKTTTTTTTTTTKSTTEEPVVTTFRSKKGRRFKSNSVDTSRISATRKSEDFSTAESSAESNALSSEDTSASDARALELLRSLYTIAAKWG